MDEFVIDTAQLESRVKVDRSINRVKLNIRMKVPTDNNTLTYLAPAPIDRMATFSGSGLPFPSPETAIEGTPSQGSVQLDGAGRVELDLPIPNSYYAGLGTVLVPPTVYIIYNCQSKQEVVQIKVDEPVPMRTLTYDYRRTSVQFYDNLLKLPVRSQEQIIRDSAYTRLPNPDTFWGLKPAC